MHPSSASLQALLLLLSLSSLTKAEDLRFTSPTRIATIDLDQSIRTSAAYQSQIDILPDDGELAEMEQRATRDEIKRIADQAKTFTPGSPEYRAAEERWQRWDFVGAGMRQSAARQAAKREAERIYHEMHEKARAAVAAYAREQKLDLVIDLTPTSVRPASDCGVPHTLWPPQSLAIYSSCPEITAVIAERLAIDASSEEKSGRAESPRR